MLLGIGLPRLPLVLQFLNTHDNMQYVTYVKMFQITEIAEELSDNQPWHSKLLFYTFYTFIQFLTATVKVKLLNTKQFSDSFLFPTFLIPSKMKLVQDGESNMILRLLAESMKKAFAAHLYFQ